MIELAPHWAALTAAVEADRHEVAGWITGAAVRVQAGGGPDRFGFDDAALLALVRAARSGDPPRALFHSHPDGRPALSAADRAAWAPTGVPLHRWPQLVIATRRGRATAAALFGWVGDRPLQLARYRRAAAGGWSPAP